MAVQDAENNNDVSDSGNEQRQLTSDAARRRQSRFVEDEEITAGFEAPPGDEKRGAKLFKKHCAQCHSVFPDGRHIIGGTTSSGPTLWNVYMRTAGIERDTSASPISPNMNGIVWNDANLMRYMKNPKMFIDGAIGMNFFGLPNFQDRVDIIHYLRTLTWTHPNGQRILSIAASHRNNGNSKNGGDYL